MVSRKQHLTAALDLRALGRRADAAARDSGARASAACARCCWGAVAFAAVRLVAMLHWLRREFGATCGRTARSGGTSSPTRCRSRSRSASRSIQINYHQYVVASQFDAATFAIYAVGCLQIPLVDLITTSTANVMMVKMAEDGLPSSGAPRWRCGTTRCRASRSSSSRWPSCCCSSSRDVIVTLFTEHVRRQRADLHGLDADDPAGGLRRRRRAAGVRADAVPACDEPGAAGARRRR